MKKFEAIYQRTLDRKGGEKNLAALLSDNIYTPTELQSLADDRYLAEMSKAVFKAGFSWKVVDLKWPGFEKAFWNFNIDRCAWMSPDDIDALVVNKAIIRNHQKITSVLNNATMILEIRESHGSFAKFIADWPSSDFIGLLSFLNKNGNRLGPRTSQYFLRFIGKDSFILSSDGVAALIDAGVVDRYPTSQRDMKKVQEAYNIWQQESGLGLTQISKVLALSIDTERTLT